ncbi:Mercuric transport protein, MerT [hydrothermal vent metagenome]|uniref:Mercuric transport protein, MerT n=1 Tax=hydrothermal vent metagenome TaxID=652676 RepID=A0A3B0TPP8_9ZZZZ
MNETTSKQADAGLSGTAKPDKSAWSATGASVIGALALTSCCILPLVLVSFGISGVFIGQMASLYQYKWITFTISIAFLAYAFFKAYSPPADGECADGSCARPINRTLMRSILWVAAAVMAVAIIFPYLAPYFLKF